MAQEKEVKEKPKRTRKTQKSAKEKPYVEQINELLFVHNKEDPKAHRRKRGQRHEKRNG